MDRITPKEVLSMMQAVAQVYEQPEAEQLDEIVRNLRPGETIKQYDERKRKEAEAAAKNRDKIVPDRGAYDELTKAQQDGAAKRKEVEDKTTTSEMTPAEVKAAQDAAAKNTVPAGSFNVSPKGSPRRNEVEAQIKRDIAARTDDERVQPKPKPKPQLTDQQKVRAEYDRLRYSKDPKERAQAAGYGKAMASAGAAKKDFSGYKSAADLAKSNSNNSRTIPGVMSNKSASGSGPGGYQTPVSARPKTTAGAAARVGATPVTSAAKPVATAPVTAPATPAAKPKLSIADRLQQIRDMRARSQSRITAQGGTPATPAANPTPKAAPPSTTGATTTPVAKANKKQPLKNGDPMERMTGKGAASLMETYSKVYEEREPQAIDEGIMDALKKVGKAVLGPADQSPEAEAARKGKRRPQGEIQRKNAVKMQRVLDAEKKEDVDLFDIIKGHFIEEGLTEEEALVKMFELTEDEKCEILNKTTTEENQ
jgi:hypothetical protein